MIIANNHWSFFYQSSFSMPINLFLFLYTKCNAHQSTSNFNQFSHSFTHTHKVDSHKWAHDLNHLAW
ncbi:unnamed protein product [Brassica oleracea]